MKNPRAERREKRSKGQGSGKADAPASGGYCTGNCAVCSAPIERRPGPGRPREYCGDACREIAAAVHRIQWFIAKGGVPPGARRYFVSELLNRLPVDREALRERARRQARGNGGRWT